MRKFRISEARTFANFRSNRSKNSGWFEARREHRVNVIVKRSAALALRPNTAVRCNGPVRRRALVQQTVLAQPFEDRDGVGEGFLVADNSFWATAKATAPSDNDGPEAGGRGRPDVR